MHNIKLALLSFKGTLGVLSAVTSDYRRAVQGRVLLHETMHYAHTSL